MKEIGLLGNGKYIGKKVHWENGITFEGNRFIGKRTDLYNMGLYAVNLSGGIAPKMTIVVDGSQNVIHSF